VGGAIFGEPQASAGGRSSLRRLNWTILRFMALTREDLCEKPFCHPERSKDLVFSRIDEILRSLRSLSMTGEGVFAEVSICRPSPVMVFIRHA
jgi:hypothetical protein